MMEKDVYFSQFMNGRREQKLDVSGTDAEKKTKTSIQSSTEKGINLIDETSVDASKHGLNGVAGMQELKDEVRRDFIEILNNKELADAYKIMPPSMMLYGAPGNGKTFFVKKLAEELDMNFMSVAPDDIASIYVHGTQEKIASIFTKAIENAPTLLFFDEFDSMVPHRQQEGGQSDQSGEVAEFLTQMNNLVEKEVYLIVATNHPEAIDKAVLRSGRIDKYVYIPLPDKEARMELFRIELSGRPVDASVSYETLADLTDNYTASDITCIVKEAVRIAFDAARRSSDKHVIPVSQAMIEKGIASRASSVSDSDIQFYEDRHNEFSSQPEDKKMPAIGFNQYDYEK